MRRTANVLLQARHIRNQSRVIALLILLGLIWYAGCQRSERGEGGDQAAPAESTLAAAGDSAQVAAPDSAAAPQRKGFLSKLFGGDEDDEPEEEEPVPVELARATIQDMPAYLGTTATLEPEKQADIQGKIAGEVLSILVEEGDWVHQGQVLARLDGATQQVALEEAEARFNALDRDLERAKGLFSANLASEKELSDAKSQVEQAGAQRRAAELQLDYTRIEAPFAGQIAERFVDPGQTVAAGIRIFSLVDRDPLLARIHLPEREALKIEPGQEVVISPDTDLDLRVPGEVLRVAPVVDARTGTVKVTCRVSDPPAGIRPGSFVRVSVRTDLRLDVLAIPKKALVPEGGETYVFRVEADSVVKVPVTTGLTNHVLVEVVEGLAAGQEVVTVGQGALKTGSKVRDIHSTDKDTAVADSAPGAGAGL